MARQVAALKAGGLIAIALLRGLRAWSWLSGARNLIDASVLTAAVLTIGFGVLRWAPVLLLAFAGLWWLWRSRRDHLARAVSGLHATVIALRGRAPLRVLRERRAREQHQA